jgi:hypothetical protein
MVLIDIIEAIKYSEYLQRFIIRWVVIIFMVFFIHGMIMRYHTRTACQAILQMYVSNNSLLVELEPNSIMIIPYEDRCGDNYKLKIITINNETTVVVYSVNGGSASTRIKR